ncbi:histidine kinase-like protein [Streptomyces sp. 1114.5]|uniref:ATP-binding SpoIIE family protein phosphatase n=1 Tax=Streptomyces sp. 1114.5 TaxID=1938830 RepID=UPI000F242C31|nr:ATP-binding SpoIIE family protein phosphatase [Streptomyces sp. 1114.5]RKT09563.1 histidine kinase-like protein [Streptomyces sp. 1114.5]
MLERRGEVPEPYEPPEPEVRAFVEFIGRLFAVLGTTLTRYAARCSRDKGSVSRYFRGQRIAPKDFVDELLRHVGELGGKPVTAEVQEEAHRLRMEALRVRNASRHEVEQLRDKLGSAERELHLASVRERHLLRALEATEAQAHQAEQRYRQLESDWATAQYASGAVGALELYGEPDGASGVRDELLGLKVELEALRAELARAQSLKHAAEERCVRLEARLLAAEATLDAERTAGRLQAPHTELESVRMALSREFGQRVERSLDLGTVAGELCALLVRRVADFASVDLVAGLTDDSALPSERPGDRTLLRRVSLACTPGLSDRWGREPVEGDLLTAPGSTPQGRALQQNAPVLVPVTGSEAAVDAVVDPALPPGAPFLSEAVGSSVLALPLSVRGTVFGVVRLVRLAGRGPFGHGDADHLQDLVVRAALSMDIARLHGAELRMAATLQKSMLPTLPDAMAGVRLGHRYLPGERRGGVGGDWFDAIQLPGSRVALVVGDVMGQGLHAAQTMARLRAAIHALAGLDLPPGQLLRHLDNLAHMLGPEQLATCLYAVYDPINRTCELASAGHVPPVLVHADGVGELLEIPSGAPIGVGGVPFVTAAVDVPDGSMLVLFTDGLVEFRDGGLGEGLAALCSGLIDPQQSPDQVCDTVLAHFRPDDRTDDIALLVARLVGIPSADVATWQLEPETAVVRRVRWLVLEQLEAWGLEALMDTTELLVSELVTNAIRVARDGVQVQLIRTDRLLVEVSDDNHNLPSMEPGGQLEEGGRGLVVVSKLAERWGTARKAVGKVVFFELPLPRT